MKYLLLLGYVICAYNLSAQPAASNTLEPGAMNKVYGDYSTGIVDGYYLYLPINFKADKTYPLLIFLQGGGGVGDDLDKILPWGIPQLLSTPEIRFEGDDLLRDSFLVVCPHLTAGPFNERQWFLEKQAMEEILEEVAAKVKVDSRRIYLTGLSRGGAGAWGLASKMPGTFAAVAPLCGVINGVSEVEPLGEIPIWVAHKDKDQTVPYSESVSMVKQIEEATGVSFRRLNYPTRYNKKVLQDSRIFVTYAGQNHDVWSEIYSQEMFYRWLLVHRLLVD